MRSWAEMHVRNGNIDSALTILKHACSSKSSKLYLNIKCWQLMIDLMKNKCDQAKLNINDADNNKELENL
jgi:hypothetical protein